MGAGGSENCKVEVLYFLRLIFLVRSPDANVCDPSTSTDDTFYGRPYDRDPLNINFDSNDPLNIHNLASEPSTLQFLPPPACLSLPPMKKNFTGNFFLN